MECCASLLTTIIASLALKFALFGNIIQIPERRNWLVTLSFDMSMPLFLEGFIYFTILKLAIFDTFLVLQHQLGRRIVPSFSYNHSLGQPEETLNLPILTKQSKGL